jgi:heterodisulfide reductase subunit A-like polyferredoxin
LCEYGAININENEIAKVDELKCKGCGVCISSCPARSIDLKYYRDSQFEAEIKGIVKDDLEKILEESSKIEN